MEAASARYASRDRFAYPHEPAQTPLQRYITNACSPENFEPNLALALEIADLVNAKKGTAPREAAIAVVGYINHRNPNVSMNALSLLDILVKNCGYPFHLQISTKEFLNELVRRFPERPPVRQTRVMNRILELVEEWRQTICTTSKYKEDLGFVRDMHRLLSYKGYMFPSVRSEDAAVLNPSEGLKSADEMEAEEREAQSAKLQELIRRGTPHDLQEANKLMKVMAGYDTRRKTDYRAKAAEEVGRVQQKARLLEEMLQSLSPGEEIKDDGLAEELAGALASAHPKIQRMCEEESDDHEAVAKLFEINDSIHRTIQRYKLIRKGDVDGANAIQKGTLGISGAGVKKGPDNELSLIDFGGLDESTARDGQQAGATSSEIMGSETSAAPALPLKGNALEDDLLGLSMGDDFGQGGGISLGTSSPAPLMAGSNGQASTADIMAQFSQAPKPATPSMNFQQSAFITPPSQPQTQPVSQHRMDAFASLSTGNSRPSSKPGTPQPGTSVAQHAAKKSDPFASLSTPPRSNSPALFQFQQSSRPLVNAAPAGATDLLGMGIATQSQPAQPSTGNEDEWTFSSALPEHHELQVTDSELITKFDVSRASESEIIIQSKMSNNTSQPIGDLTFQLAVTKGYTLKLEPQSSRSMGPKQQDGIVQTIRLQGVERGKGPSVKMRWRASFTVGGQVRNEQGEINGVGIP
ncbi:VHS-domain-containing protein [Polychaeton citri CBS 116435]|uniref:VHS-domain-containing protein n=1 Tax=Polychaeton citri CBS 116435 TaxID=1314669 RepID=A0A9P4QC34_9PEZI|nr:VHS-domain-containing protein [Polychaeton citri CBS 116435]